MDLLYNYAVSLLSLLCSLLPRTPYISNIIITLPHRKYEITLTNNRWVSAEKDTVGNNLSVRLSQNDVVIRKHTLNEYSCRSESKLGD